jgi:outer membrane protein TolC
MEVVMVLILLLALAADPDPKTDAEIVKLQKERVKTLREVVKVTRDAFDAGRVTLDRLTEAAGMLLEAELDLATKPAERIAARQAYLVLAVEVHKMSEARFAAGTLTNVDRATALAARLKAEIDLRREGGKPPKDLAWPGAAKP